MKAMRRYIRVVDGFNYGLGRIMMYGDPVVVVV